MLITPKDKNIINTGRYYIIDNTLDKFVEGLTAWKTGDSKQKDLGLGDFVKLFKVKKILLVLETTTKIILNNRNQKYYRIYNGDEIFWGEQEDFEEV
jgi:hypothetical protein